MKAPLLRGVGRHPRITLTILVAILGIAGLATIPPLDRDEPAFAQASRQMLESRNFIDIRFQDAPRYNKPILTYWLQAGSAALFSTSPERNQIWVYRLPSLLAIWIATLLTFDLGRTLFDRRSALGAAALFASTLSVQIQAHQARADALLVASMLGVAWPLARVYLQEPTRASSLSKIMIVLFWASLAAAILIKGPVVPAVVTLAVASLIVFDRRWTWLTPLRPAWGIPLFLLIVLPWPLAMLWQHGLTFFVQSWETDILPKIVSGQESHGAPPLSYALASPLILWPASLLLPYVLELAWRNRRNPSVRFCAAMILPGWLMFELAPTKLPHYVLPFMPMLAVLMSARSGESGLQPASLTSSRVGVGLFALASVSILAMIYLALTRLGSGFDSATVVGALALLVFMAPAAISAWRLGAERSVGAVIGCGILASLLIFGLTLPRLERLWVADRAARAVRTIAGPEFPTLVVGYREPSLVFLLGRNTRFTDAPQAATALKRGSSKAAIVAGSEDSQFAAAIRARGVDLRQVATIDGIDPVHARPIRLGVWTTRNGDR